MADRSGGRGFRADSLMQSVFRDDYALDEAQLETLYSKSKRHQWNAELDVAWKEFAADAPILDARRDPLTRLTCYRELPDEVGARFMREVALFTLSQILHGEQAALMTCGQLVNLVPDVDGKFAAAVQVMDEARHVEVFARYLQHQGHHYPIDPDLQAIVSQILAEPDWEAKCVGMQVILESIALGFFRTGTEVAVEPVLRQFIGRVHEDEARHVAYGVLSLGERIPELPEPALERLQDLAYDAIYRMAGRGGELTFPTQVNAIARAGIDVGSFLPRVIAEFAAGDVDLEGIADPMAATVIPNLIQVGLVPARHLLGYLAQGWRIDLASRSIEDLHSFHPEARAARAELEARGRSVARP